MGFRTTTRTAKAISNSRSKKEVNGRARPFITSQFLNKPRDIHYLASYIKLVIGNTQIPLKRNKIFNYIATITNQLALSLLSFNKTKS